MRAKRDGVRALPEEAGLFVVEAGELKRFVPGVGHHGSRWAGKVLGRFDLAAAPELEAARRFVRRVLS